LDPLLAENLNQPQLSIAVKPKDIDHFLLKDTSFANLMQMRIYNILLIARKYEAFMLEDDCRIDEKIFMEYVSLNLRYPPRFTLVVDENEALVELNARNYDLVIVMPGSDNFDIFSGAKRIKEQFSRIPIVVLTPFSREVTIRLSKEDLSAIDYVFSWLGNADLLLAIIKLLEDKMNAEADMCSVGVQAILVVEDNIRFYSSMLPHLYKIILKQSTEFSKEALNEHEMMLRMRGRPKILLARTYEEALSIYQTFKHNLLGVISDISFMHNQVKDKQAGIQLCSYIRKQDPFLPIIMESSDAQNRPYADQLQAAFLDKSAKSFPYELESAVIRNFGFGEFEFINPETQEVLLRIKDLNELQHRLHEIPRESLLYHASHNHISRWLYSRAIFPLAEYIRNHNFSDFGIFEAGRDALYNAIVSYRQMRNQGVVAIFRKERFDRYSHFTRIGNGSLGGKGRGLAFIDNLIKRHHEFESQFDVPIRIPKTLVLCSDLFEEFMENNGLYPLALGNLADEEILQYFLQAQLPDSLHEDCKAFAEVVKTPIAIRSSSTLEDSHYQPFAGVYKTYMIPQSEDMETTLRMISVGVKSVYASVFYKESKAYLQATQNMVDEEKMSIILQEVIGKDFGDRYYPSFSGVAQSINYYPINGEKIEEGVANIALGLGKYIVDGGVTLRFSPSHPQHVLQLSTPAMALKETQMKFYALDKHIPEIPFPVNDGFNLLSLSLKEAEKDQTLQPLASTFELQNQIIRDSWYEGGRKLITFSSILKYNAFPLAEMLRQILTVAQEEMGCPVEIEFAVNLNEPENTKGAFYWLQIRPIVNPNKSVSADFSDLSSSGALIYSEKALGHMMITDVADIIYVKSTGFCPQNNPVIAREIERLNQQFIESGCGYILVGPGRWGTADPALGIPVKWAQISSARLIVETVLDKYRIDPSQGTHFFQNLTSFGVGYFTVNPFLKTGFFDEQFLNGLEAVYETEFVRHVRLEKPLLIKINGKKGEGVVRVENQ
jgi:Phosphoenolpyruvate synthase/pyruvate phosphate dikinase